MATKQKAQSSKLTREYEESARAATRDPNINWVDVKEPGLNWVALLVAVQRASRERAEAERRLRENAEQAARRYRRLDQDHNFLVDFFQGGLLAN